MDPLSVTASIIAVLQLSAKVLVYISDVRDAPKERSHCEAEISNLSALLRDLRDHVQTGDLSQPWYTAVAELAAPKGLFDQFKHALEALQNKITDGGRLKKVGEALVWKFKKEEVAGILHRIERLKTLVEIALQMDHFKLSQAIKDDTNFVRTHVPAIQSGVDKIQQDQADAKHSKIVEWISPTDYPAQQSDIIGRRQEGTGQWFLDAPEFARWLGEPKSTLFCSGIPGAGKTMVAAIAIDHLLKSVQSSSVGIAYVYCNYKAQEEQDASSMLAAVVKQLVQARPSAAEPVERLHKQHADRGTKPSLEEIFGALREVVAKHPTVYVVIDALDECRDSDGTRSRFLSKLRDLQAGKDVRLMATSRFIPEVEVDFRTAVRLEVRASDEDVRRFVAGQMYRLPKCIQRDPTLQKMVEEKIPERVDGMFLLARLHIDSLSDKTTAKMVKATLANLSKGSAALDDAYKDALQRIKSQLVGHYKLAKKVLSWITYARRPLTTAELCCALAVEPEEADLDPENIPDVEDLLSVCAGLAVVDRESAVIRLVHYTTQEYFERIRDTWNPGAQLHIVSICLTYLSFDMFKTGSCSSDKEFEERLEESKFLDYAAKHWGEHAVTVEGKVYELACSFLSDMKLVSTATQAFLVPTYNYTDYSQAYPKGSTGLHLAARFGLSVTLEDMLPSQGEERAIALQKKDSYSQTLLYLAAENGYCGTTELLLDKGADVNAEGGRYGNALQAASEGGHEATVKLLLDKGADGADVNAQGGHYGNALQAASSGGHEAIVKLLIGKGAAPSAEGTEELKNC
ncbi:ankyrin [Byssothecium circinans]|uniref:Ankyrin n=1 Tax=Byssothecium circinans TaxID=147558 RepID=A0A6A5U8J7_9PLEO|nr:ankyrin [Byssothecium circinans]